MIELDDLLEFEEEDLTYILEPIFNNSNELLELPVSSLSEITQKDQLEVIEAYCNQVTKMFQIIPNLIGIHDLVKLSEETKQKEEGDLSQYIIEKIDFFANENMVLKIQTEKEKLKISPDSKLLITPLGIFFLFSYYSNSNIQNSKFGEILEKARINLGRSFTLSITERVLQFLEQTKAPFTKNEIIIGLFLLLCEATSEKRAVIARKADLDVLHEVFSNIASKIFPKKNRLFLRATDVDNAIRRSGGATGLEGKTSSIYTKNSLAKADYALFFELSNENFKEDLSFLVERLLESIASFAAKDNEPYLTRTLALLDEHITYRNKIFGSKPYVAEQLLSNSNINTSYLNRLYVLIKNAIVNF